MQAPVTVTSETLEMDEEQEPGPALLLLDANEQASASAA
jgi:hypothetical protein